MISLECFEHGFQRLAESQMNSWHSISAPGFHRAFEKLESKKWDAMSSFFPVGQNSNMSPFLSINVLQFWAFVTFMLLASPVVVFSVLYLAFHFTIQIINSSSSPYTIFAQIWFCLEGMFFAYRWYLHPQRSDPRLFLYPLPTIDETKILLNRILHLRTQCDADEFLGGWFLGTPVHCIRKQNMRQFLAYSLYHRSLDELNLEYRNAVENHLHAVECCWALCFEEGWDPAAKFMSHTIDPLHTFHHPLLFYLWGEIVAVLTGSLLHHGLGFQLHSNEDGSVNYWIKPAKHAERPFPSGVEEGGEAIFFLHGLGIGITPYLFFLHSLIENSNNKTVIVLEFSHVALRLVHRVPTSQFLVNEIVKIHSRHQLAPSRFIAHSYGSLVLANLCRQAPHLVSSLGFLDPVCFLLCLPDVVFNFIYRAPKVEASVDFLFDLIRWVFCSKETQVAQTLCRGFDWHQLHLWGDQLHPWPTVVLLAGKDRILPPQHVKIHLNQHGVKVLYHDNFQHAECLFSTEAMEEFFYFLNGTNSK